MFIKRIRWRSFFFLNPELNKDNAEKGETYGFNSRKTPQVIPELKAFEDNLVSLIQNVELEKTTSQFQRKLNEGINMIRNDDKLTVKADKTTNYYKMEKDDYVNLVRANVTKTYKKTEQKEVAEINREAKRIAVSLELGDRID